jgi:hypothetical protein
MVDDHVKVLFRLERDEDGFPPADVEGLWAQPAGSDTYRIDNVPFFVRGIAVGDIVRATRSPEGELWFQSVAHEGGHGTIRIIVRDDSQEEAIKATFRSFGCSLEQSHIPGYFSADVPPAVDKAQMLNYLHQMDRADICGYEEACRNW